MARVNICKAVYRHSAQIPVDGMLDGMFSGMFGGMFDGMFNGMFDGVFDGMVGGLRKLPVHLGRS